MSVMIAPKTLYGWVDVRPGAIYEYTGMQPIMLGKPSHCKCQYCLSDHNDEKCPNCGAPK